MPYVPTKPVYQPEKGPHHYRLIPVGEPPWYTAHILCEEFSSHWKAKRFAMKHHLNAIVVRVLGEMRQEPAQCNDDS